MLALYVPSNCKLSVKFSVRLFTTFKVWWIDVKLHHEIQKKTSFSSYILISKGKPYWKKYYSRLAQIPESIYITYHIYIRYIYHKYIRVYIYIFILINIFFIYIILIWDIFQNKSQLQTYLNAKWIKFLQKEKKTWTWLFFLI